MCSLVSRGDCINHRRKRHDAADAFTGLAALTRLVTAPGTGPSTHQRSAVLADLRPLRSSPLPATCGGNLVTPHPLELP